MEAWVNGDLKTALLEIDDVLQTLESMWVVESLRAVPLGNLYHALGKRELARGVLMKNLGGRSRHWALATMAHNEGDYEAMASHLREYLDSPKDVTGYRFSLQRAEGSVQSAIMLAEAGFLSEAEGILAEPKKLGPRYLVKIARGIIELRKGNTSESVRLFEEAIAEGTTGVYFSSLILSEAWIQDGQIQKAGEVLEEASRHKYLVLAPYVSEPPIMWLRIRAMLAGLYREMDRDEDARKIEAELRTLLAYADADHPILRQLDRTKELALREPAN